MHDFSDLVERLRSEYRSQPGLTGVLAEGTPAIGLRYQFTDKAAAESFLKFRTLQFSYEPANANELCINGCDVIETWRL